MARSSGPDWPAMMLRATAAGYCDMTSADFEREVIAQRLPMPVLFGGAERWNRRALDEALERLVGGTAPDWRTQSNLYATR